MTPRISQYLNKTILVSIPVLFEDGACRAYRLIGVEVHGLWLQSEELIGRLASKDTKDYESLDPVVFVPFGQIASVMLPTRLPPFPQASTKLASGTRPRPKTDPSLPKVESSSPESRLKRKK